MSAPSRDERDALIAQFVAVAGPQVDAQQAETFLATSNWELETAVGTFFAASEGHAQDMEVEDEEETAAAPPPASSTGPRTLDGRPVPVDASSAFGRSTATSKTKKPQRGVAGLRTLKDVQSNSGQGQHQHDDDDDDDEDYHPDQDLYAGGEKSGLAVENPGQPSDPQAAIRNMIKRAGRDQPRPGGDDAAQLRSHFHSAGQTLGGDDTPSIQIPGPTSGPGRQTRGQANQATPERRDLHLWRDGFSVDDGPLYRYDDPANRRYLDLINQGQAPTELLNVSPGMEVDVHLDLHRDEDYVKPKTKYKPFGGSGQRLGSPTPGVHSTGNTGGASSSVPAPSSASSATTSGAASSGVMNIDESQPSVLLQIRLGDGTRLRSRFNTTHTIGDVYSFVNASNSESAQRSWALMTTFPSKELGDHSATLGNVAELKKGGSVVQKWT